MLSFSVVCFFIYKLLQTNEACNVHFHSKLAARTECFTSFGACGFDSLQSRLPILYNKTGWRRDPPSNIKLTSFCEPNSFGVNQSGINIQWNLPNSQSAAGIAGYELRIEGDPPHFRCLVVILEEKATQTNIHYVLNSTIYPVRRHQNYIVVLHSLPRANNSEPESEHVRSMNCKRGSTSSSWVPAGHNYSYKWQEKLLVIWFQAPPPEFNISQFQLDLIQAENGKRQKISNTTEVEFTDVEPGKYTLYMQPYDEHLHDRDLCVCRDDERRCEICMLNEWLIDAKIPKMSSSKSQGHEIIVGVLCACVVLGVLLFLMYKMVAKRYGIECVIGKRNKTEKDEILHVMCIGVNSTKQDVSRLRLILENDLDTEVKFNTVVSRPECNMSSELSSLWKEWKMDRSSTEFTDITITEKPVVAITDKSVVSFNVLICLLIANTTLEEFSQVLSTVHSSIPRSGPLRVQVCAVTFAGYSPISRSTTVMCFSLSVDQDKFVTAVKKAFPRRDKGRDVSVHYSRKSQNSDPVDKNKKSGIYVALKKSKSENSNTVSDKYKMIQGKNSRVPEVMYLSIPEQRRERYVSNDSGHGESVVSCKTTCSTEDTCSQWPETNIMPSEMEFYKRERNVHMNKYQVAQMDCPSCDISFFAPDPSVMSENDMEPNSRDTHFVDDGNDPGCKMQNIKCLSSMNGLKMSSSDSMDSLMDKMTQINERSALVLQLDFKPGEVHSVWEGHA